MVEVVENGWPELLELTEDGPRLVGGRCERCQYVSFPFLAVCPRCLGEDTTRRVQLATTGVLENYTVAHQAPKGFTAPYIMAFVRLPEGVLVFTHVDDVPPADDALTIGETMSLTTGIIRTDDRGRAVIGYKFKPSRDEVTRA